MRGCLVEVAGLGKQNFPRSLLLRLCDEDSRLKRVEDPRAPPAESDVDDVLLSFRKALLDEGRDQSNELAAGQGRGGGRSTAVASRAHSRARAGFFLTSSIFPR